MKAGVLLQGRFRIGRRLSRGGMGEVWKARGEDGSEVIVKTIRRDKRMAAGISDEEKQEAVLLRRRFDFERRVLQRLDGVGTPRLLAQGQYEGEPYMVMEYIDGKSLDRYPRGMPLTTAVSIAVQLVTPLERAHALQIVHRDVKPMNVVVSHQSIVYLLDFGIACSLALDSTRLTDPGGTPGSMGFKAPELIRGDESTPAADLYGYGCILFHLLTGRYVFNGENGRHTEELHLHQPAPRVSDFVPDIPADIDDLVVRLLAKQPQERPGWPEVRAVLHPHLPAPGDPLPSPAYDPDPTRFYRCPDDFTNVPVPTRRTPKRRSSGRRTALPELADLEALFPEAERELRTDLDGAAAERIGDVLDEYRDYWGLGVQVVARAQLLWAYRCLLGIDWARAENLCSQVVKSAGPDEELLWEARVGLAECLVYENRHAEFVERWCAVAEEVLAQESRPSWLLWRMDVASRELMELGHQERVGPLRKRLGFD